MREVWGKERSGKANFKFKMLPIGLFLVVFVVLGITAQASDENVDKKTNQQPPGLISFFDPFNLNTIYIELSSSRMIVLRGPQQQPVRPLAVTNPTLAASETPTILQEIRIPYRPAIRSPYRPPLVLR
jgi:hypothetical protein